MCLVTLMFFVKTRQTQRLYKLARWFGTRCIKYTGLGWQTSHVMTLSCESLCCHSLACRFFRGHLSHDRKGSLAVLWAGPSPCFGQRNSPRSTGAPYLLSLRSSDCSHVHGCHLPSKSCLDFLLLTRNVELCKFISYI